MINGKQLAVAKLEQQAKSGRPISLMDLSDAVHRENSLPFLKSSKISRSSPAQIQTPQIERKGAFEYVRRKYDVESFLPCVISKV